MKIQLIKDWSFWTKGTVLNMHPQDGQRLIKEKIGKKPGLFKQIKEYGNNRNN